MFAVTFADYPEAYRDVPAKVILDGVRDGLKGKDGKVEHDDDAALGPDKVPGRAVKVVAGSRVVRARVFLHGTRLYEVMVTGPKDAVATKAADEFLKSFEIVK